MGLHDRESRLRDRIRQVVTYPHVDDVWQDGKCKDRQCVQPGYVLHPRVEVEVDDEDESCESCDRCFPLVDCAAEIGV